jgi:hypothetical protein
VLVMHPQLVLVDIVGAEKVADTTVSTVGEILSNVVDEGRLSIGVNGPRKRTYPGGLVDFYAAFLSCSSPSAKVSPSTRWVMS